MEKRTTIIILFSLLPTLAFANAGSPMMWFGMLHLSILNAFIAGIESVIVNKLKIENRLWLIIIANYTSMIIGLYYIAPYFSEINGNLDFWGGQTNFGYYKLQGFVAGMITSFFATLIIEFPFFFFAVRNKTQRLKVIIPFVIANTFTNIIMTILYFLIVRSGGYW